MPAMLRIGEVVTVYEDPITCQKPEGRARIVAILSEDLHRYQVKFEGDLGTVERAILPQVGQS